jgi:radical SAM superfamily enzyme YgiQ (UPF0313 family)
MYKDMKFQTKELGEIQRDLQVAARLYHNPFTLFIGDSDSLVTKVDFLEKVLETIGRYFPSLTRITSYTRGRTLARRRMEDLERLKKAGLRRLHVGLETGDARLLEYIQKGLTPQEMEMGGRKAISAGFELSLYVLLGIGGEEKSKEHALHTAQVLNKINPHFIRLRTYIPLPGTVMYYRIEKREFNVASPITVLRETRLLVEHLEVSSKFFSDHASNYAPINGRLPGDRGRMLAKLDVLIKELEASPVLLKTLRERQKSIHL